MMSAPKYSDSVLGKAACVRLMAFDVDGVLTDGRLYFSCAGEAMKAFHVRDGAGLKMLQNAGIQVAIITGRDSDIVRHRAADLGITLVLQGVSDKLAAYRALLAEHGLSFSEAGFMGDDMIDLPSMRASIFSAAPPDAVGAVKQIATYLTDAHAGRGAAREVCDLLLCAQAAPTLTGHSG